MWSAWCVCACVGGGGRGGGRELRSWSAVNHSLTPLLFQEQESNKKSLIYEKGYFQKKPHVLPLKWMA